MCCSICGAFNALIALFGDRRIYILNTIGGFKVIFYADYRLTVRRSGVCGCWRDVLQHLWRGHCNALIALFGDRRTYILNTIGGFKVIIKDY
jgi:hypothetical protein